MKIALLGFGTVGSGVYNILKKNASKLERVLPEEIEIKTALVRDPELMEQTDVVFTNNINDIVHDPEIELVVEVMGGITTAYEYVRACLLAKKSVVTANKNLIAVHGVELTTLAKL